MPRVVGVDITTKICYTELIEWGHIYAVFIEVYDSDAHTVVYSDV